MRAILLVFVALVSASSAIAQNVPEKAKQVCAACHGIDGNGVAQFPDYPKIAGQHYDYLLFSLQAYKSGTRKNAIMASQAQPLTADEMRELARYYSKQKGTLYVKR